MRKVIYHVATSIDGFIAQENDDIDLFPREGVHVEDYIQSLAQYDLSIMGRRTYEFGYRYGLQPGENPYPQMTTYVYSKTLKFSPQDANLIIIGSDISAHVKSLKKTEGNAIYLCGGGILATYLLNHKLIDELHVKLNPIIIAKGIPLFADSADHATLDLQNEKRYENGVLLLEYRLSYLS